MKRRWPRAIALALPFGLASTGCYSTVVERSLTPEETSAPVVVYGETAYRSHGYLFGLIGTAREDITERCIDDAGHVWTRQTFGGSMLSLVTLGIYSPQRVVVRCYTTNPEGITQARLGERRDAANSYRRAGDYEASRREYEWLYLEGYRYGDVARDSFLLNSMSQLAACDPTSAQRFDEIIEFDKHEKMYARRLRARQKDVRKGKWSCGGAE